MNPESLKRVLLELKGEAKKMRKDELKGRFAKAEPEEESEVVEEPAEDGEEVEAVAEETEEAPEEETEATEEDADLKRVLKKMGI